MKLSAENLKKIAPALQNLKAALAGLREGCELPKTSNLELSGTIQYFEFCYELSWKLLQKRAAVDGRSVASPREAFRYGFEKGYIESELIWSQMILDRNLTVHTYDRGIAQKIYDATKVSYYPEFVKFVQNFELDFK